MIPGNALSTAPIPGEFLSPDSAMPQMTRPPWDTSTSGRCLMSDPRDWELGGIAIEDPSRGLEYQSWQFFHDTDAIYTGPDPDGPWTFLFTAGDVTELSGAFDIEMRPAVAYVVVGDTKLWWYDPVLEAYDILSLAAYSPRLTLDDKRSTQAELADLLLFYLRDGNLYYRQQRERFVTERLLCACPIGTHRLGRVGMADSNRVQVEFLTL